MSPRRPVIGAATDAANRNAVKTQVTLVVDVWSARWMFGSAGATIDCGSE
jgi:hypothetical protein